MEYACRTAGETTAAAGCSARAGSVAAAAQNASAACIKGARGAVAPSWTGWWTCPYEDCQAETYRYNCSGCHERLMSNKEGRTCPDCD